MAPAGNKSFGRSAPRDYDYGKASELVALEKTLKWYCWLHYPLYLLLSKPVGAPTGSADRASHLDLSSGLRIYKNI